MDMITSTFVKADHNTPFFTLFFLISTITFLLFIIKKSKLKSTINNLPPGPTPLPIIGNLHQIGNNPIVSTAILARQYGPLISLRLGQQLMVVASSPEAAMGILKTQDRFLSYRLVPSAYRQENYIPHTLLWSPKSNQIWKNLRTLCRTQLFSVEGLESHSRILAEKVSHMVDFLRMKQGQVIDIEDVVFTTLWNTLSTIIFGKDLLQFADGDETTRDWKKESIHKLIENGGRVNDLGLCYPMLDRFDLHGLKKETLKEYEKLFEHWDVILEERRAVVNSSTWSSDQAQCLLDRLHENGFTNYQIYQFVMELLIAGSNTTTSAIIWTITELLRHKQVMSKLEEELQREIKSDQINVSQSTYLQSCIKETYRLHPSIPLLLPRMSHETCEVMNYTIPKNALVFVNAWAMGRDPEVWHEPLRYMPERFTDSKVDFKGQDFKLLPFGSGRRICAGMLSGNRSLEYILTTLVREFAWALPNGDDPSKLDMENKFGIAMKRKNPLKLIMEQK